MAARWARVSTDKVDRPATSYTAKTADNSIRAFRDEVLAAINEKNLVDVRSPDEFSGKILAPAHLPQEQSQRPGHITGAINVPWSKTANDNGTFKSDDELTKIYADAGLDGSKETIPTVESGNVPHHFFLFCCLCIAQHILHTRNDETLEPSTCRSESSPTMVTPRRSPSGRAMRHNASRERTCRSCCATRRSAATFGGTEISRSTSSWLTQPSRSRRDRHNSTGVRVQGIQHRRAARCLQHRVAEPAHHHRLGWIADHHAVGREVLL